MLTATVRVGWTSSRPVIPDEHVTHVIVSADTEADAMLIAAQMIAVNPQSEMPTSTEIIDLVF